MWVSFAEYRLFYRALLQKRHVFVQSSYVLSTQVLLHMCCSHACVAAWCLTARQVLLRVISAVTTCHHMCCQHKFSAVHLYELKMSCVKQSIVYKLGIVTGTKDSCHMCLVQSKHTDDCT